MEEDRKIKSTYILVELVNTRINKNVSDSFRDPVYITFL